MVKATFESWPLTRGLVRCLAEGPRLCLLTVARMQTLSMSLQVNRSRDPGNEPRTWEPRKLFSPESCKHQIKNQELQCAILAASSESQSPLSANQLSQLLAFLSFETWLTAVLDLD